MATTLKTLLAGDRPPIGHLIFEFATPGIGYLVRNAGADFMVFDMEHSAASFETAKLAVLSARAAGIPIVVRVPSRETRDIARACDIGAEGVMAPNVESAEEARAIVAACKYAPEGRRGVGQVQMHDAYRIGPFADKAAAANQAMTILLQIESDRGADAADAIAAVPGVDCLWIGHMDLSCSLGTPGRFDTPAFAAAVRKVIDAARKHGKRVARLAPDAQQAAGFVAEGFDCLAIGTDTQVYQNALASAVKELRSRLGR